MAGVLGLLLALVPIAMGCRSAGSPAMAAGPVAAADARLVEYLQKRLRLTHPGSVRLSPALEGPVPGLWSRIATITNNKGATAQVHLFADAAGEHVIIGQAFDTRQDPWGRIDVRGLHLDDRASLGPPDAPVTMIEFGDFECPFCAHALDTIETALRTTYKDRVRLIFKHFPLNSHPWARTAAVAAQCVRAQNPEAFWDFARDLYRDQNNIDATNLKQHLAAFAAKAGLDQAALQACTSSRSAQALIQQDIDDGRSIRVGSTPTILIDGIVLVGEPDSETLDFVLDSELKRPVAARSAVPAALSGRSRAAVARPPGAPAVR